MKKKKYLWITFHIKHWHLIPNYEKTNVKNLFMDCTTDLYTFLCMTISFQVILTKENKGNDGNESNVPMTVGPTGTLQPRNN